MSGFVLLWRPASGETDRFLAELLAEGLSHRGPDGRRLVEAPGATLAHLALWASPEDVGFVGPASSADGRIQLLFDGRLDRRRDLLERVGRADLTNAPDAELALAAYERWPESFAEELEGELALAILDRRRRKLVLARDGTGARTLFLGRGGGDVVVASEGGGGGPASAGREPTRFRPPRPLLRRRLRAALGVLLLGGARGPPGNRARALRGGRGGAGTWPGPLAITPRCGRTTTRLPRFAGACPTPSVSPCAPRATPALLLSGGLDSTSLAALAVSDHGVRPRAVSWVFDELSECDERRYLESLDGHLGLPRAEVLGDALWPLSRVEELPLNPSAPLVGPYRWLQVEAYRAARRAGARVVLSGMFADHLYTGTEAWLSDSLLDLRFQVVPEVARLVVGRGRRVVRSGLAELARRCGLRRSRRAAGQHRPWLTVEAASRLAEDAERDGGALPGHRRGQAERVLGLATAQAASWEARQAAREGLEVRYPFRDFRVIDLMLRLPAYHLLRHGRHKHVQRLALAGRLPATVLERSKPTELTALFRRGLERRDEGAVRSWIAETCADWSPVGPARMGRGSAGPPTDRSRGAGSLERLELRAPGPCGVARRFREPRKREPRGRGTVPRPRGWIEIAGERIFDCDRRCRSSVRCGLRTREGDAGGRRASRGPRRSRPMPESENSRRQHTQREKGTESVNGLRAKGRTDPDRPGSTDRTKARPARHQGLVRPQALVSPVSKPSAKIARSGGSRPSIEKQR